MRKKTTQTLSSFLGEKPSRYLQFYAVSKESRDYAEDFKPRSTDIIVSTYSKTGTTLVQQICQQLRTPESYDDEKAMRFEEVTQQSRALLCHQPLLPHHTMVERGIIQRTTCTGYGSSLRLSRGKH